MWDTLVTLGVASFGAVVGGAISVCTTNFFQKKQREETEKSRILKLTLALSNIYTDISNNWKYLKSYLGVEPFEINEDSVASALRVPQIILQPSIQFVIDSDDLSVLMKYDGDLVTKVIELDRARRLIVQGLEKYNTLKGEIDSDPDIRDEFSIINGKIISKIDFNPDEHPLTYGKMLKAASIVSESHCILMEISNDAQTTIEKYNAWLKDKYPDDKHIKQITIDHEPI